MNYSSTIQDSIEKAANETLTHSRLFLRATCDVTNSKDIVIFNFNSLVTKYIEEIKKNYIQTVELSDEEQAKYRFNPKGLSYDLYGTTELWSSLLLINNIISQVDFTPSSLYVFKTSILDFFDEVFVLEEGNINDNMQYIENIKKNNK